MSGIRYTPEPISNADRERAKEAALNKVRSEMPREKGIRESVRVALEERNFHLVMEFTHFIRVIEICDEEIVQILKDACNMVPSLTPDFVDLVEALLSLNWIKRSPQAIRAYTEFGLDVMITHTTYIPYGITKLVALWKPNSADWDDWRNGLPSRRLLRGLQAVHSMLNRILTAVPMAFDAVIDIITAQFPYFKKPAYVTAGYIHNVLWLVGSMPVFEELLLRLVLQKLIILDVNAPREELESDEEETDDEEDEPETRRLDHPIGRTLDLCLLKLLKFLDDQCRPRPKANAEQRLAKSRFFKMLLHIFDEMFLCNHSTHHVQFVMFHACSIRPAYAESFLKLLWEKAQNPKFSQLLRHVAVSYIASFLARSIYIPIDMITYYLKELSNWANAYIDDFNEPSSQHSPLNANMLFYSICQAVFYLIAFRVRDLTYNEKNLRLLNTLQLTRIVLSHFNPLRYCLPTVVAAFVGVTRTHHLAYCHTVLETNSRRKLATIYGNDRLMPEETLESFFPFDPYILPRSSKYIEPNYIVYRAQEKDEVKPTMAEKWIGTYEMVAEDVFIQLPNTQQFDLYDGK